MIINKVFIEAQKHCLFFSFFPNGHGQRKKITDFFGSGKRGEGNLSGLGSMCVDAARTTLQGAMDG